MGRRSRSRERRQVIDDLFDQLDQLEESIADLAVLANASSRADLDAALGSEVQAEVAAILALVAEADAFDVIELLRLRELPIVPALALRPDYDGNGAVLDLVALALLCRTGRAAAVAGDEEAAPHEAVQEIHDRASRLLRLATFWAKCSERLLHDDPMARLAAEYQSYFVAVRALQYESIQRSHDAELFERPEVERFLIDQFGFTFAQFEAVRLSVRDIYSDGMTSIRDSTGGLMLRCQDEGRDPTDEELIDFRASMTDLMFLPGERASFTAEDVAEASGIEADTVSRVLDTFSISFGLDQDPADAVFQLLRGRNPLATRALVRDEGRYLTVGGRIGADAFRAVVESELKSSSARYIKSRTIVSENLAAKAVERILQTPPVQTGLKYFAPREGHGLEALSSSCADLRAVADDCEADAVFVIDDVAVCLEVKGRSIHDAARRGDRQRLQNEVKDILGGGAGQARRLATLITTNGGVWQLDGTWLDLSAVREVHSMVVGLDYFGPLSVALGALNQAGLIDDGPYPWLASMHDLEVISRVLDRPAEFLLYLRRRTDPEIATHVRGFDELDLFMRFLNGNLYRRADPDHVHAEHPHTTQPTVQDREEYLEEAVGEIVGTHTNPLDAWMYWVEGSSPDEAPKPTFKADASALALVDFLADGRKPGWFRFGADMLSLSERAHRRLDRDMRGLVAKVGDGQPHSLGQGYAGLHGHPVFFAIAIPAGEEPGFYLPQLDRYMTAKKHQLRADRALGLLVDADGGVCAVRYLNDLVREDVELDRLVDAMKLQRQWEEPPLAPPPRAPRKRSGSRNRRR